MAFNAAKESWELFVVAGRELGSLHLLVGLIFYLAVFLTCIGRFLLGQLQFHLWTISIPLSPSF